MPWPMSPPPTTPIFICSMLRPSPRPNRHPEVAAKRPSKDDRPGPPPFEAPPAQVAGVAPQGDGYSSRRVSAVDIHDLPGAEIGCWREQIDRHADEVLDLAEPSEWNARKRAGPRLLAKLIIAIHPGGELGAEHGRRNRIDGDAVLRPLGRKHAGEPIGGALGGAIAGIARDVAV